MFISRFFLAILIITSQTLSLATAATIHVPKDYPNIQDAIDAAVHGDTVLVSPGTYKACLDFKGKAITVQSTDGPEKTAIDGTYTDTFIRFCSGETSKTHFQGFLVKKGIGEILCSGSSPVIRENIIKNNQITDGAGITCMLGSCPLIEDNRIIGNYSVSFVGGIACLDAGTSPVIRNNLIANNHGVSQGGGIYCGDFNSPAMTGNHISENKASCGGGIFISAFAEKMTIENNLIEYNISGNGGGGASTRKPRPILLS